MSDLSIDNSVLALLERNANCCPWIQACFRHLTPHWWCAFLMAPIIIFEYFWAFGFYCGHHWKIIIFNCFHDNKWWQSCLNVFIMMIFKCFHDIDHLEMFYNEEDHIGMFPLEFLVCGSIHLWWSCLALTAEKQATQLWSFYILTMICWYVDDDDDDQFDILMMMTTAAIMIMIIIIIIMTGDEF